VDIYYNGVRYNYHKDLVSLTREKILEQTPGMPADSVITVTPWGEEPYVLEEDFLFGDDEMRITVTPATQDPK
jgi:hypothetical protein